MRPVIGTMFDGPGRFNSAIRNEGIKNSETMPQNMRTRYTELPRLSENFVADLSQRIESSETYLN